MPKTYKSKESAKANKTRRGNKNRRPKSRPIPNAYMSRNSTFYKTIKTSNNSVRVRGFDLVSPPILTDPISDSQFVFACITCNPAYWTGTRVASIASAYSQFRPMKFNLHYFPQVSTTTNGLITAGTIWDNDIRATAFQQTLATSNGGRIHPVYVKAVHRIALKTALSRNMFDISGFLNSETNPFTFVSSVYNYVGIIPGYYMVEWEFEFKNPVGDGISFESSYASEELVANQVWDNTTIVLAQTTNNYPPGTTFHVRLVDSAITYSINGNVLTNSFKPLSYYLYRSYTGAASNNLLMRNLPTIKSMIFSYVDTNQVQQKFEYDSDDALKLLRIGDNARSVPYTGWILWSQNTPKLTDGWWGSVVIRYILNTTPDSVTDYDVYVIDGGTANSAMRTSLVTSVVNHKLYMTNDGAVYESDGFAGSIKVRT